MASALAPSVVPTIQDSLAVADSLYPVPTTWYAAGDDDRIRALVTAQARVDAELAGRYGRAPFGAGQVPGSVTRAVVLLAMLYLMVKGDPFARATDAGLTDIRIGNELAMSFDTRITAVSAGDQFMAAKVIPLLDSEPKLSRSQQFGRGLPTFRGPNR